MKDNNSTLVLGRVEDCNCHIQGAYMQVNSCPLDDLAPVELAHDCPLLFAIIHYTFIYTLYIIYIIYTLYILYIS